MANPFVTTGSKQTRLRLWPLLFLPIVGFVAGVYFRYMPRVWPFIERDLNPVTGAARGLLAGTFLMILSAFVVLAYRLAGRRFTIGNIMATIAVIAVLMGLARAVFP
jgi:hypothetical protein